MRQHAIRGCQPHTWWLKRNAENGRCEAQAELRQSILDSRSLTRIGRKQSGRGRPKTPPVRIRRRVREKRRLGSPPVEWKALSFLQLRQPARQHAGTVEHPEAGIRLSERPAQMTAWLSADSRLRRSRHPPQPLATGRDLEARLPEQTWGLKL